MENETLEDMLNKDLRSFRAIQSLSWPFKVFQSFDKKLPASEESSSTKRFCVVEISIRGRQGGDSKLFIDTISQVAATL